MRALYLFLVSLTACSCGARLQDTSPARPTVQQLGAVVKIKITCKDYIGFGTGVVVSSGRVLTAQHVVTCKDTEENHLITVDPGDGVEREADVEVLLPSRDIARLQLHQATLEQFMTPVAIGERPQVGDELCATTAAPHRGYFCGRMQPSPAYRMDWDHFTQFGNSGSGVYHNGKLIGLVVVLHWCQEHVPCAGGITPLQGVEWLVP